MRRLTPTDLLITACLMFSGARALASGQDNNVEWWWVFSDTTANFVSPMEFDAGATVTLKLRAGAGDLTSALCRLWFGGPEQEARFPMAWKSRSSSGQYDYWAVSFTVPSGTDRIYYRFEVTDGADTDYYDAGAPGDDWAFRGISSDYRGEDYNFLLVPGLHTPTWSRGAVFYQIFPDRFYDGDSSNNVLLPDDCFPYYSNLTQGPALDSTDPRCTPYGEIPYSGSGDRCQVHDDWDEPMSGNDCEFFGGDLAGITSKMDYLEALGVNALILTPIFRSPSVSKFDVMDFASVDPRFGGKSALETLSSAALDHGIKLVADGVFNRVSELGQYMNLWQNYRYDNGVASGFDSYTSSCGAWENTFLNTYDSSWPDCSSSYRDWFRMWVDNDIYDVDHDGDTTESAAQVCPWSNGYRFMPMIDYKSPLSPNSASRRWLYGGTSASDPAVAKTSVAGQWLANGQILTRGLDGWLLSAPAETGYFSGSDPHACNIVWSTYEIWQQFRSAVKAIGSEKYIVGEFLDRGEDGGSLPGPDDYLYSKTFDGVTNYGYFTAPISCFVTGIWPFAPADGASETCASDLPAVTRGSSTLVDALDELLATQRRLFPASGYLSSQNALSTHDTIRFMSRVASGTSGQRARGSSLRQTLQTSATAGFQEALFLQATLPGSPSLYYGDEVALLGVDRESGRVPFPWSQLENLDTETQQIYQLTKTLMCLRNTFSALRTGSFVTLWVHNYDQTYGYGRFDENGAVAVVINNSDVTHSVELWVNKLDIANGRTMVEVLDDTKAYVVTDGQITVQVEGRSGKILVPVDSTGDWMKCLESTGTNLPPYADAGPDQVVTDSETIVLDGSRSWDDDGDALTYRWADEFGEVIGTSAMVTLGPLPVGSYIFTLEVSDGEYSDSDVVKVTVQEEATPTCGAEARGDDLPRLGAFFPFLGLVFLVFRAMSRRK